MTPQYTKLADQNNLFFTEPSPLPLHETSFLATATTMLVTVEITGRAWGLTGQTFFAFVGDSTLGRRPRPTTQAEYFTYPTGGLASYPLGLIEGDPAWTQYVQAQAGAGSASGSGKQRTICKTIKVTGLTVGHTINVDVCCGVAGGADKLTSITQATGKIAVAGSDAGTVKCYLSSGTTALVRVVTASANWSSYAAMSQAGGTISLTAKAVASAVTPDLTKIVFAYFTSTSVAGVQVVSTTTDAVTASWPLDAANCYVATDGIAITSDSLTAWLLRPGKPEIVAMTLSSGALGTPIAIPASAVALKLSPDNSRAHVVSNGTTPQLNTYNTATGATVGAAVTFPAVASVTAGMGQFCLSADGLFAYCIDVTNGRLYEVDLTTRAISRTLVVGGGAGGKSYVAIKPMPGSITRSLLLAANNIGASGTNQIIAEVHVADWTVYTEWTVLGAAQPGSVSDIAIGQRGEIFMVDSTHTKLDYFYGGRFAVDNLSSNAYLHQGEGVQVVVRPGS